MNRLTPILMVSLLGASRLAAQEPPVPVQRLRIRAEAQPGLNRDPVGNPLSVVVRVYQLKDRLSFAKLSHEQAASGRSDAELLGPACLGQTEFTLAPGAVYEATEAFLPVTEYLGVVALFRQPDPHHWRGLAKVAPPQDPLAARVPPKAPWYKRPFTKPPKPRPRPSDPQLTFTLQDCYLRLQQPPAQALPGQPEPFQPRCDGDGQDAPQAIQ